MCPRNMVCSYANKGYVKDVSYIYLEEMDMFGNYPFEHFKDYFLDSHQMMHRSTHKKKEQRKVRWKR